MKKTAAGRLTRCVDFPRLRPVASGNNSHSHFADTKLVLASLKMDGSSELEGPEDAIQLNVLLEDIEMDDAVVQDIFFGSSDEEE